jgi:hypothetical protein
VSANHRLRVQSPPGELREWIHHECCARHSRSICSCQLIASRLNAFRHRGKIRAERQVWTLSRTRYKADSRSVWTPTALTLRSSTLSLIAFRRRRKKEPRGSVLHAFLMLNACSASSASEHSSALLGLRKVYLSLLHAFLHAPWIFRRY